MVKTFWGWSDVQLPDGTVIWTSPAGRIYITRPGSRSLFPALCRSTGELPTPTPSQDKPVGDRTLMMPKRKHTRAQNRAQAIKAERALNDAHVAWCNQPPPF